MAELHSPASVAALLGIVPGTLRKWSQEFAALLSPSAAASGPTARRRYTDSDIAQLRQIQALLQHGATYAQARERLAGHTTAAQAAPDDTPRPIMGEVTVIQPSDEREALLHALQIQRETLDHQRAIIDVQQAQIESLTTGINAAHQETADTRADLVGQLEATRARLAKVPRWLRALFGAVEE